MAVSIEVYVILGCYAMAMAATFYICVLADPKTSPMAKYITHTLPTQTLKFAADIVGNKGLKGIEAVMEKLLAIIYLAVVLGCYVTLVHVSFPKAYASEHVADYHMRNAHIVCLVAITTWFVTMTASPGIITKDTLQFYDHFPYDDLLYVEGRLDIKKKVPRIARSKFDRLKYHEHVPRFDHYCGWVASTIGEENYRVFLFFVLTQFVLCVYCSTIITIFFLGEIEDNKLWDVTLFDRITGVEYKATKWIIVQFLVDRHVCEAFILCIVVALDAMLTYFLYYHFSITSRGMTTNEHFKWGEVKKWHASQVRRYEHYKRDCCSKQEHQHQQQSTTNGDVGCLEGTPAKDSDQEEGMRDPGPMPKNVYNVGFVENWKQVLFPISLRKKREAAIENDKRKAI